MNPQPTIRVETRPEKCDDSLVVALLARVLVDFDQRRRERDQPRKEIDR